MGEKIDIGIDHAAGADRAEQLAQARLQRTIGELPTVSAPPALWLRLQASLDQRATASVARKPWTRRISHSPLAWSAALAACTAMLFLWFFWLGERPLPTQELPSTVVSVDELSLLRAASADLEGLLHSANASTVYGDDQAWVEHTLQRALRQVDAELAGQPAPEQARDLWTQRVALLAGLAEQSQGAPLGNGVEWVQLN